MVGTLVRGCRYVISWCNLDLTFDLGVVTFTFKILSGLYLRNCKVTLVKECRCATSWGDLDF